MANINWLLVLLALSAVSVVVSKEDGKSCKTYQIRCLKSEKHCETRPKCLKPKKVERCFLKKGGCKVWGKRPRKDCADQCERVADKDGLFKICTKKTPIWTAKTGRQCLHRETRYYDLKGCSFKGLEPHRELECDSSRSFSKCTKWSKPGKRTVKSFKCVTWKKRTLKKGECIRKKYKCEIPNPLVLHRVCLKREPTHRHCYQLDGCAKWDKDAKRCWQDCKLYKYKRICRDAKGRTSAKYFNKAAHGSQTQHHNTKKAAIKRATEKAKEQAKQKAKTGQKKDPKEGKHGAKGAKSGENTNVNLKGNDDAKAKGKKGASGSTNGSKGGKKKSSDPADQVSWKNFKWKSSKGKNFWAIWLKCRAKFTKCLSAHMKRAQTKTETPEITKKCKLYAGRSHVCNQAALLKTQRQCAFWKFKCLAYTRAGHKSKTTQWCGKARSAQCCARAHPSDFCLKKKKSKK